LSLAVHLPHRQYAHNHGVTGNFYPEGWYGLEGRNNTLATWLDRAGYRTGLIGKWLNGYGALDAHGEIPPGFDDWHALLDVSAYDYYNFEMNSNGRLFTWGDPDFARKLVEFANIEVTPPDTKTPATSSPSCTGDGSPALHYWGASSPDQYSPDDGPIHPTPGPAAEEGEAAILQLRAPAAPHRQDVATTLMGQPS
jgi:arylsulfatase A-like enzyme